MMQQSERPGSIMETSKVLISISCSSEEKRMKKRNEKKKKNRKQRNKISLSKFCRHRLNRKGRRRRSSGKDVDEYRVPVERSNVNRSPPLEEERWSTARVRRRSGWGRPSMADTAIAEAEEEQTGRCYKGWAMRFGNIDWAMRLGDRGLATRIGNRGSVSGAVFDFPKCSREAATDLRIRRSSLAKKEEQLSEDRGTVKFLSLWVSPRALHSSTARGITDQRVGRERNCSCWKPGN